MATITHHGHGVYCYMCQEVHDGTDGCDHRFDKKAGVEKTADGYAAQPNDMGHMSPHMFVEIDGMKQCTECNRVKIPTELVDE